MSSYYMYWYRQGPSGSLEWIYREGDAYGEGFKDRFKGSVESFQNRFTLQIQAAKQGDEAVYFCDARLTLEQPCSRVNPKLTERDQRLLSIPFQQVPTEVGVMQWQVQETELWYACNCPQQPLGPFLRICFPAGQPPAWQGGISSQVRDFALPLIELHGVPVSPLLQPVEVPLDGSTVLCVSGPCGKRVGSEARAGWGCGAWVLRGDNAGREPGPGAGAGGWGRTPVGLAEARTPLGRAGQGEKAGQRRSRAGSPGPGALVCRGAALLLWRRPCPASLPAPALLLARRRRGSGGPGRAGSGVSGAGRGVVAAPARARGVGAGRSGLVCGSAGLVCGSRRARWRPGWGRGSWPWPWPCVGQV
ncbi:PREDICTED: uncharacterized protein LOC106890100 [Calidris pugnax]|uniref:uncharacterized protein LOC106890100 n=1 Tax=Calidris pugnax TaxID=198806 RepID=UPI00071C9704|nr:PREDICTED: uncharacterized protein LOC106890100 [Calidris pugnax]